MEAAGLGVWSGLDLHFYSFGICVARVLESKPQRRAKIQGDFFIRLEWRLQYFVECALFQDAPPRLVDDRSCLFMGIGSCHYCGDASGINLSGVVDGPLLSVGLDCNGPQLGNDSP